ncbi:MAG: sigma-70 family RNA polymerase sigma factor [Actinomycetota bacterium]|nr:sigma-70 family RNA polymerase sigma factor [Actinomycetota bacterium]
MATALDIEAHRPHLIAVGYRLTGSRSDAEDAVQDAWLRLRQLTDDQRAEIRDLRAWLTTAVGRLCLDRLRSAAARRESYVGPWLPEPLVSTTAEDDPLTAVVRDEDVRMAAMVLLERLTPPQRVAFVLHDALSWSFEDIAEVLGCSVPAARQHASRARRAVADAPPPPRSDLDEQRRMLANIADAIIRGDSATLVSLLHPDAVLISDSGGMAPAARRVVHGADKVARLLIGLANRHGTNWLTKATPVMVNGEQGYWTPGIGRAAEAVTVFSVADGLVVGCYSVLNPAKLSRVPGTLRPR